jgi:ATP phosphoribosyltransferase regulatory subunit
VTLSLSRAIDALLARHAPIEINPPVLQPAGLYLELAGEDLRKRAFLIDNPQGEELCLRPDMTVPACRAALALPHNEPFAVRYQGLVFRRQSALNAGAAEFVQVGAEWFAPADAMPAREPVILATALEACRVAGAEPELRIGNVGLFAALVESAGLDPVWSARLIRAFARAGGPAGVMAEALTPAAAPSALAEALATMPPGRAGAALSEMLEMAGVAPVGGRSVDDIAARLREQGARAGAARPTEAQFEPIKKALAIEDTPEAAMRAMAALAKPGSPFGHAVEKFRAFWEQAGKMAKAPANTRFVFGLGRGISYYDGLVFELEAARLGPRASLGGGGRYDGLLQALAAGDESASRFANWAAAGFALRPKRLEDAAK